MANEISDDSSSISAEEVAIAFVRQYYLILHSYPEDAHKFYQDSSVMARPGSDGKMTQVSAMKKINDEIMSIDYKEYTSKINIVHAQYSNESVLVGVTGHLTGKDNDSKNFAQTFLLAPQTSGGYYVMNDFLFYFDIKETVTSSALTVDDVVESAVTAPLAPESETTHIPEIKKVGEEELKPSDQAVCESAVAKSEATDKAATSKTNVGSVPMPAATFQADPHKKSYASMVAKESESSSPTPVAVRVNPGQQSNSDASSTSKPAISQSKAVAPTSKGSQGKIYSYADGKSIHIRDLPCEITDEELIEGLKGFGAIREGSIRFKRFEDGFCYAFLEFEMAESAQNAVEAETVFFGERNVQIQYKIPSSQKKQGGNNRGRSPGGKFRGRESGNAHLGSPGGNENHNNQDQRAFRQGRRS